MRILKTTIALVLLVLWVPITTHCIWEGEIGGDLFKCSPETAEKGDCSDDADRCVAVESPSYKVPETTPPIPVPVFGVVLFEIPAAPSQTCPSVPATAAPAELAAGWTFLSRAACPPRAPSFS